jgi:predicted nucleic acid-binding protein
MAMFYLDTSALVKRYKTEEGSETVDYLYDNLPSRHSLSISFLTVLEFVSAIRRLLKEGNISDEEFRDVLSTFSQEVEPFLIRSIDDKIVADALTYVTKHGLKSADSIQLATVMELRVIMEGVIESVIFVCDDEELAKAGREENLEVINPRKEEDKLKLKGMLMRR